MRFRLFTLLTLALLLGGSAAYLYLQHETKKQAHPQPLFGLHEPHQSELPALLAQAESSGEITRRNIFDPGTGKLSRIEVGYKDQRRGQYIFADAKLHSYRGYNKEGQLVFEADYENGSRIFSWRRYDQSGKLKTQFQRLPDASEQVLYFNERGFCIGSLVTAPDGTQLQSKRPDPEKPAQLIAVKAEAGLKTFGKIKDDENGEAIYRLKIELQGVRVKSWEYRNKDAELLYRGRFTDRETVEVSFLDQEGKTQIEQVWKVCGEDWSGPIYRLKELKRFNSQGELQSSIELWEDGVTPRQISSYYFGHKNSSQLCDRAGRVYRNEYFDSNGSATTSYDIQEEYRQVMRIHPSVLAEASDEGKPVLRLKAGPYSRPFQDGFSSNPLFEIAEDL